MKNILLTLEICLLWAIPTMAFSAENKEISQQISTFFNVLQKGNAKEAVTFIVKGGPLESQLDGAMMTNLINQINNSLNLYGSVTGFIAVRTRCIGEVLCKARYLSIQPNYPLKWEFIFYKPNTSWALISINFNDEVEELLGK